MQKLEFLDCTIRDGGYLNRWNFTDEQVKECYKSVSQAGFNYFEIGFKTNSNLLPDSGGKWMYSSEKNIDMIKHSYKDGCKIAVMAKLFTFKISDFVHKSKSNIDLVRLLIPKHDDQTCTTIITDKMLKESFKLSTQIIKLGYELSLNLACANLLSISEINNICDIFKPIAQNIKCIYFADTYGTFDQHSIVKKLNLFKNIQQKYNINIPMAFHAHNNCQDGLAKSLAAIDNGILMIDSCITGLGRGCGNLISEFLLLDLNKNIDPIIKYADKYYKDRLEKNNFLYFYGAKINCHPNYINDLLNKPEISFPKKCKILDSISKHCHEKYDFHYNKHLIQEFFK